MYGMTIVTFFPLGGAFHRALIFMLKLGWKSRFRLPVLMVAAFVVLDIRMQLEIDDIRNGDNHENAWLFFTQITYNV